MASSPLLLRRQCLSPLGPLLSGSRLLFSSTTTSFSSIRLSSYCFLFLFRSSALVLYLLLFVPPHPSSSLLSCSSVSPSPPLFGHGAASVVLFVPLRWSYERSGPTPPSSFSLVGPPRDGLDATVTRITRIASKTANNKCSSAPRNVVKFLPTPILPARRVAFPESRKPRPRKLARALFAFLSCGRLSAAVRSDDDGGGSSCGGRDWPLEFRSRRVRRGRDRNGN